MVSPFNTFASDVKRRIAGISRLDGPDARLRLAAMAAMTSVLAHEISQPLSSAANYIQAALRRCARGGEGMDELTGMLKLAARDTLRAGERMREMRRFVLTGKVLGRRTSLETMLEHAATGLFCPDGTPAETVRAVEEGAAFVVADRILVEQVLRDIFANAAEAMEDCPVRQIAVRARRVAAQVEISITDTGTGLSDHMLARLFEPLFTTKGGGSGLSLPICKTIVEAHGGSLWAERPEAGGASFILSLPAAD